MPRTPISGTSPLLAAASPSHCASDLLFCLRYSLVGGFCGSAVNVHAADGSGYAFLADCVLQLDKSNAQVASRLAGAFSRWRRYDGKRQEAMKAQMERLAKLVTSENVIEIITKSLA